MLLPIGDDTISRRVPVVNTGIIAINVLVFAAVNVFSNDATTMRIIMDHGLKPADLKPSAFLTCMFLHGGWAHIIGNMWFLWVFGEALENRIGHLGYAVFYLVAGIGASGFYLLFTPKSMIPCVGASGAIFGVVTAYAILYPRNQIKMFYWIGWFWAGTFEVSAMWIVGFWFLEQVGMWYLMSEIGMIGGGIAYAAHIGGAVIGGVAAAGIRAWMTEPPLAEEWDSTPAYSGAPGAWSPNGFDPPAAQALSPLMNSGPAPAVPGPGPGSVPSFPQDDLAPLDDVAQAFAEGNADKGLQLYQQHLSMRPGIPLAAAAQSVVASTLWERADFPEALDAYREFVARHGGDPEAPQAKFRAAVILSRRMESFDEASKLLLQVVMEHPDPEVVALARGELSRIRQLA